MTGAAYLLEMNWGGMVDAERGGLTPAPFR